MEPQITDYYNEMPHMVNIIDNMNNELSNVQKEYEDLKKEHKKYKEVLNKYDPPIIIVRSKEEYDSYNDKLNNVFTSKIKEVMNDPDIGIINIMRRRIFKSDTFYDTMILDQMKGRSLLRGDETCVDIIINELNKLTNYKNEEWCYYRIWLALENCFKINSNCNRGAPYPFSESNIDEIIESLIEYIFGEHEDCVLLGENYRDFTSFFNEKCQAGHLDYLIFYNCSKCNKLDNYHSKEHKKLLCCECELMSDSEPE